MSVSVQHLSKSFPTRGEPLVVLHDISFHLGEQEAVAITGPSGSGKSTLLHIIGTLDTPTTGTVTIQNVNPFSLSEQALAQFRNESIGFIFQDHHLLPQCNVLENVLIPTLIHSNRDDPATRQRAEELIERVGLKDRLTHRPAELSGGERQRVAVARALINQPILLLADEPTGNLDSKNAQMIGELLLQLQKDYQANLVVVTHSHELAATFPKQYHMSDGQIQESA